MYYFILLSFFVLTFIPIANHRALLWAEVKPAPPGNVIKEAPARPVLPAPLPLSPKETKQGTASEQTGKSATPAPGPGPGPVPSPGKQPADKASERVPLLDDNLIRLIITAPKVEMYPQANAAILLREEIAQASEAKGLEFVYHVVAKIFNDRGVSAFEVVPFPFDSFYQEINVEIARTIQPDGRIIETPAGDILVATPPEFSQLNFDPGIKSLVISLPDLQPESIVEYKIKVRHKKAIIPKRWWDSFTFQWAEPVLKSRYVLSVPKQERFFYSLRNIRLIPRVNDQGDWRTYTWEIDNLEAITLENFMPPAPDIAASLLVSSLSNWNEVDRWYTSLFSPHISPDEWLTSRAKELTRNLRLEEEKMRALYYFTLQTIKFIPLSLGQGGYGPRSLREVLLNGNGDSEDIAALLISLLQSVDIKAYPALISSVSQGEIDVEIPSPGQFNHLIVFIPRAKGNIWLDPTKSAIPYGSLPAEDQDRWAFIVDGSGGRFLRTPSIPYDLNQHITRMKIWVKEDGSASVEETWEEKGIWDEFYRSLYLPLKAEERKEKITSYMSEKFPNAKIKEIIFSKLEDLEIPFKALIKYEIRDLLGQNENLLATKSDAEFLVSEYSWSSPSDLKNDISFKRGFRRIIELSFILPEDYKAISWIQDISMDDPLVSFGMVSKTQGNEFQISYEFVVKKNRIKKEEYNGFYQFIHEAFKRSKGMIAFEGKAKKEPVKKIDKSPAETAKTTAPSSGTASISSAEIISSGRDLLSKGNYDQALEFFKKAVGKDPKSGEAHYYLGVVYGYLNQYELAEKEFQLARQLGYKP